MRVLGFGQTCDLGSMYWRLGQAGHEVRVHIGDAGARDVYGGMLQLTDDWAADLPWILEAGSDGVIVFETAEHGELQDELRHQGYQVIGGSAYGDRLEGDREFGQQALCDVGLQTAPSHTFRDYDDAIGFIGRGGGRFVYKSNGAGAERCRNYVGQMDGGEDMLALLRQHKARCDAEGRPDFVLMEHVEGIEVGVGAYFNGQRFLEGVCIDFEHKRLFAGDVGELTGEMGTIVSYRGADTIFNMTLRRMEDKLRAGGYCGYINLNLIANAQGLWPLEFTSRFGYPGYAICETLHLEPWEGIFRKMLDPTSTSISTAAGFSAGVVLTVPPFPHADGYERLSKGLPVTLRDMTPMESQNLHFCEVAMIGGELVTSGHTGYVGVATGAGNTVESAAAQAYALARKVVVPNLGYRTDIGKEVAHAGIETLRSWGLVPRQF
ncbi:MAG: phosphoribosylamine--glycine ligase [Comamonadaceae bacterium]|nr:MAG: phosphoribosylamine--glycine ligase [Comamonadaceae bacterium]